MLKNLKLGVKLNLLLIIILLGVIVTSGVTLSLILENYAEDIVASQALILIETMGSVREYTNDQVRPQMASFSPDLEDENREFLRETIPAYSAREVFENLRDRQQYRDFFYKEATLNPTNPRDKADSFEAKIVEEFRNNTERTETTGFRNIPGGKIFYVARPLAVEQASCLQCHSTPEIAPPSQIQTYGNKNGFGWELNEIVGARIVSVPASRVFGAARNLNFLVSGIIGLFLLIAIVLLNLFLKFTITNPLVSMARLSKKVSTGDMSGEFEQQTNDEIGILAASLNRMKVSLQMAMDMLDQKSDQ